jgi:hypothetical protein
MKHILRRGRRIAAFGAAVLTATASLQACARFTDPLLEAEDPDIINPSNLASADGATAIYLGTFTRLRNATIGTTGSGGEGSWLFGGLLADEWSTSSTFVQNDETDQRSIRLNNSTVTQAFRALSRVRTTSNQAIAALKEYRPTESANIAEMYFHRGFAEMQLAQDFCNGIPISDAAGEDIVLGPQESVDAVFKRAVASFDSALALVGSSTDAASVRVARATRIAKARALLGIGLDRAAEAAALVTTANVPTTFTYDLTMSQNAGTNSIWSQGVSQRRYSVGDSVEGNARNLLVRNAIPFFSSGDPRIRAAYSVSANGRDTTKGQDGLVYTRSTPLYGQLTPVAIVNGIDARLVEAEARLAANDIAGMTAILNALRATPPSPFAAFGVAQGPAALTAASLPPLAVPASRDAAINLLFREKAFWTFSRGQRLGDLRRLVRQYGRTPENVFPVGQHYRGGTYGPDMNLPVVVEEEVNPNFKGCTNRNA